MSISAFSDLTPGHYGAILADPPWRFEVWSGETAVKARGGVAVAASLHYQTMAPDEIAALPVASIAAPDAVLFMWISWPLLPQAMSLIEAWGFTYKTCGFNWTKAHAGQVEMFHDEIEGSIGMGYWTRANTEPCLLATRGKPKRLNADVRQAIIAPAPGTQPQAGRHSSPHRAVGGRAVLRTFCKTDAARLGRLGQRNQQIQGGRMIRECRTCFHCAIVDMMGSAHERCMRIIKDYSGTVIRPMVTSDGRWAGVSCRFERDSIPEPQREDGDKCGPEGRHWRSRT